MGDAVVTNTGEGESPLSWSGARGGTELVVEAPHLVRIVMRGHVDARVGIATAAGLDKLIKQSIRCHTFWDLEAMTTYDSAVRVECTRVLLDNPTQVASIVALARSKVVRMGVAVANLALGNKIRMFAERAPFENALRRELEQRAP